MWLPQSLLPGAGNSHRALVLLPPQPWDPAAPHPAKGTQPGNIHSFICFSNHSSSSCCPTYSQPGDPLPAPPKPWLQPRAAPPGAELSPPCTPTPTPPCPPVPAVFTASARPEPQHWADPPLSVSTTRLTHRLVVQDGGASQDPQHPQTSHEPGLAAPQQPLPPVKPLNLVPPKALQHHLSLPAPLQPSTSRAGIK